ncbi:MAG: N-acetyltransferase [Planctomycetes bacterium]|nr:N-acetyltransferase [Planctomycetota bacterium]MBL7043647.1 N-acetyltransferase [Pirellulaceae bacterium]
MSNLIVKPVQTRKEKSQLFKFPWKLYRDDPNWIPPLRTAQLELLNYKPHPFYGHAEIQTFLALRDGQPCGRVAGIINHIHNEHHKEQRGFFGFFECVDNQEVANGLFDAVRDWFAQRDITMIRGPVNPSLNYECGLLIDGFDSPPTFMMTYNPPYYPTLIENWGFSKVQDMYAFWGHVDMLATQDKKLRFIADEVRRRFNLQMRPLDRSRFAEDVRMFLDIYNRAMEGTWGFAPMSEGEIDHMSAGLKHLIVPELTAKADVDGKTVGAVFGLLDYNPRIRRINGRLFPFGFMRLLINKKAIKRVRILSTNVVPEFQKWGLGLVLLDELVPKALEFGIEEGEFSWVLESNHLSYASLKRGGAKIIKTYRLYDWEAEPGNE